MDKDTHSIAPSEATTLVDDGVKQQEARTTLTGKPITYQHDHHSGMMLSEGGGFAAGAGVGANLLPPGYTDKSRVTIPIRWSDVEDTPGSENPIKTEKKGGLLSKLTSKRRKSDADIVSVIMSRRDYLKYWAKGPDGKFLDSVVEPPEGRKEWVRLQLELNEEMKRSDPTLGPAKNMGFTKDDMLLGGGLSGGS